MMPCCLNGPPGSHGWWLTANKLDFLRLSLEWAEAGRSHAGIVIRYPNQAPEVLAARAIAEELLDRDDCTDLVLWANAR
jgi:hypothetical protein